MPKIPDCDRCLLYAHNPYLICAVHPSGVESDRCFDFQLDPNAKQEEQWAPFGYSFCDGELTYLEQLYIPDNHPCLTGVCPT
jgi:hypothetical protein